MNPGNTSAGPLVLIVEDEPHVGRMLEAALTSQGYRTIQATTGKLALQMASQYVPDLVILDLGLPDVDGLEVGRVLREWSRAPIIVLSARGQERVKVQALDAGADDYLTKPFSVPELLARLRVALRHAARAERGPAGPKFRAGRLEVDLETRRVQVGGVPVALSPIEFRLLVVLVRHAGRVVTHKQLLQEVWGPQAADQKHYLRVYMTHLRRKLDPGGGQDSLFDTEAGVGYRLREEDPSGKGG